VRKVCHNWSHPSTSHTVVGEAGFYTEKVNACFFRYWVADRSTASDVPNVHCTSATEPASPTLTVQPATLDRPVRALQLGAAQRGPVLCKETMSNGANSRPRSSSRVG